MLLVDDQSIVGLFVKCSRKSRHEYRFCPDPAAAIEAANGSPTVILQDLVMPIDGCNAKFYREPAQGTLHVFSPARKSRSSGRGRSRRATTFVKLDKPKSSPACDSAAISTCWRASMPRLPRSSESLRQVNRAARYVQSPLPNPRVRPFTVNWSSCLPRNSQRHVRLPLDRQGTPRSTFST